MRPQPGAHDGVVVDEVDAECSFRSGVHPADGRHFPLGKQAEKAQRRGEGRHHVLPDEVVGQHVIEPEGALRPADRGHRSPYEQHAGREGAGIAATRP